MSVSKTWWLDNLRDLLGTHGLPASLDDAAEYVKRRRNLDFLIAPGSATLRLYDEQKRPARVSLTMSPLDDAAWDRLAHGFAEHALFIATLLAGTIHEQVATLCEQESIQLFPTDAAELEIRCDEFSAISPLAVLYVMLADAFERDPFSYFLFRGLDRDRLLHRVAEKRTALRPAGDTSSVSATRRDSQTPQPLSETLDRFWSLARPLDDLHYSIRADELPASLIRRLDALPFGDRSTEIELALEDAYAHVAMRAQALGLGL